MHGAAAAPVGPAPVHPLALLVSLPVAAAAALMPAPAAPAASRVREWLLHDRRRLCCRVGGISGDGADCCKLGIIPRSCVGISARSSSLRLVYAAVTCLLLGLLTMLLLMLLLLLMGMHVLAAAPAPAPSITPPATIVCTNPPAIPATASSILLRPTLRIWLCQLERHTHTSNGGVSSRIQMRNVCSLP